ncbi:MAG: FecR domain-containing protein [Bacteroidota bacterium]|nr:FecR domain-containing protein [Bacteroidota bacterium]
MNADGQNNMDGAAFRTAYLIAGFIRKTLSESEHDELDSWVESSDDNMLLFEELTDEKNIEANLAWMDKVKTEKSLKKIKEKIEFNPVRNKKASNRWIYGIAASIILLVAAFAIFRLTLNQKSAAPEVVKTPQPDIQPGGNKATLTLSNGKVVDLNNAKNGLLNSDNGTVINKSIDGEINYINNTQANNNSGNYNILSTPKGGQYKVQLADGSNVWLNAASSLRYPTAFTATERIVELTGEGYFEVAKNKDKPFIVKLTNESEVKVLGTHFNVMSYEDEKAKEVTLLEGRVEIKRITNTLILKPGQQGQVASGEIKLSTDVDTAQVTGWKNGQFIFHDADIQTIMNQVNRWYDVDIKYEAKVNQQFNAVISRNEPVSRLLYLLEQTGQIHFKIENKIIYVLP